MKFTTPVLALLLSSTATALSYKDYFPSCALTCEKDVLDASGCESLDDSDCFCQKSKRGDIETGASGCILTSCGITRISEVTDAITNYCAGNNVTATDKTTSETEPSTSDDEDEGNASGHVQIPSSLVTFLFLGATTTLLYSSV